MKKKPQRKLLVPVDGSDRSLNTEHGQVYYEDRSLSTHARYFISRKTKIFLNQQTADIQQSLNNQRP